MKEKIILSIADVAEPVRRREYLVPVVVLKPLAERTYGLNGRFQPLPWCPCLALPTATPK